jgi:hypothetical protein
MTTQVTVDVQHSLADEQATGKDTDEQHIPQSRQYATKHPWIVHKKKATQRVSPLSLEILRYSPR